uniref:Uncharacterized protein n=1 Tax=Ditylenchus dipsaci TaxID=166011 RepID=A0A915EID1_9BILA
MEILGYSASIIFQLTKSSLKTVVRSGLKLKPCLALQRNITSMAKQSAKYEVVERGSLHTLDYRIFISPMDSFRHGITYLFTPMSLIRFQYGC